jgi:hypothetical protein
MDIFTPAPIPPPPLTCGAHFWVFFNLQTQGGATRQTAGSSRCPWPSSPAPVAELATPVVELRRAGPAIPCDVKPVLVGGWRRGDWRQGGGRHPSRRSRHVAGGGPPGCCGMGPAATLLGGSMGPAEPLPTGSLGSTELKTGMEARPRPGGTTASPPWPGAMEPRRGLAGERPSRRPQI